MRSETPALRCVLATLAIHTTLLAACTGVVAGGEAPASDASLQAPENDASRADAQPAAADAMASYACDFADPHPAPADVLWPAVLSATGEATLGGHGHDDGNGGVGFCPGNPSAGQPFYKLLAVGFETDTDLDGDGAYTHSLPVDFWRSPPDSFVGYAESGGRVHVYVDIVDENGVPLDRNSAPDIRLRREILDGPTELFPLDTKPANEFQFNFNMTGGGTRYAISVDGASDKLINLRLPVNHHVVYVAVFQRQP